VYKQDGHHIQKQHTLQYVILSHLRVRSGEYLSKRVSRNFRPWPIMSWLLGRWWVTWRERNIWRLKTKR